MPVSSRVARVSKVQAAEGEEGKLSWIGRREGCLEEGQAAVAVCSFVWFLPVKSCGPCLGLANY